MTTLNSTIASSPLDPRIETLTPTVNTDFTLPSTGIKAGQRLIMFNNGANSGNYPIVSLKASNGTLIRQVYAQTDGMIVALQDTPTDAAHWAGLGIVTSNWIDSGVSSITAVTSNPTKGGTVSRDSVKWRRQGNMMECRWDYRQNASGTAGTGTYLIAVPNSQLLDTSVIPDFNGSSNNGVVGTAFIAPGGSPALFGWVWMYTTNRFSLSVADPTTGTQNSQTLSSTFFGLNNTNAEYAFHAHLPISGWSATKG